MFDIKASNTIIYCNDWKACKDWYKTKLDLPILFEKDWFIEFSLSETSCLSIANAAKTSVKSSKGEGLTITLKVDDIYSCYESLLMKGLKPTGIKNHNWGAKVIYIFDPDGNRIEFWSNN